MRVVQLTLEPEGAAEVVERILDHFPDGAIVRPGEPVRLTVPEADPETVRTLASRALRSLDELEVDEAGLIGLAARTHVIAGRVALRVASAPPPPEGLLDIVLERGAGAFGTGAHPTTAAVVGLLLAEEKRGSLLDVGCGTGVLSVVASRLGFSPVLGFDIAAGAVDCARRVAARNGAQCEFRHADALTADLPTADLVVANGPPVVHAALAERLRADAIIVSGVQGAEVPAVLDRYAAAGLHPLPGGVEARGWYAGRLGR